VLKFLQDANRPYNVQLVVDMLQKFGIKKGQVTKALDCLVEKEVISVKEFGKVKIFFPVQDSSKVLPKEVGLGGVSPKAHRKVPLRLIQTVL